MTQLNWKQELDIEEMYNQIPELRFAMEATRGWAFCHPVSVKWPAMGTSAGPEFKYVLRKYYSPFHWESYLRQKKFGIMPWKSRKVGDREIPVVPMIGSGSIWQWFDIEEEVMEYCWFWANRPGEITPDPDMRFTVWYAPDFYGNYTSPAVTALRTWGMTKIVGISGSRAVFHGSHMPQFLVHKPPKGRPGDEKLEIAFGDDEELAMDREKHNRMLEKAEMSRNAVRSAVATSKALNQGRNPYQDIMHRSPVLNR